MVFRDSVSGVTMVRVEKEHPAFCGTQNLTSDSQSGPN